MKINWLTVQNFRNLKPQKIVFSDGLNVLVGKNAQGKTNCLEAIYLATIGKSPKSRKDSEMICFSKKELVVNINFSSRGIDKEIKILISSSGKQIFLNGEKLKKLSDIIGNFGSVYFSPEELELVKRGPSLRRRFIDIINCQLDKDYLKNLQTFQRLLNQRNALLKKEGAEKQIFVWDEQIALVGTNIYFARMKFLKKLYDVSNKIHKMLSNSGEDLEIIYQSELKTEDENIKKFYLENLKQSFQKDKILGYTSFGIQNDDFMLKLNKKDVRKTSSQGQQRTVTLSLKLAELEILKEEYGEYPVLLLDDVLSELDEERRKKLCEYIKNMQCILTGTEFDLDLASKKFLVFDGEIKEK